MNSVKNRRLRWFWLLGSFLWPSAALCATDAASAQAQRFVEDFLSHGYVVTFGALFASGLGGNLTPCVYPLIPITLSIIGARGATSRGRAFTHSAVYVLGICATYTALGAFAALAGRLSGFTFQSPAIMAAVVVFFVLMALSMFGVFEIQLPASLRNRLGARGGGYAGALFAGLVAGLVAAPCTAPILGLLLPWIAQAQDAVLGSLFLFTFALGLGLPYLVLGTFSGLVARLPKSGPWMVAVKYVFGALMLGLALYYLDYVVGEERHVIVAGAALVLFGILAARRIQRAPNEDWTHTLRVAGGLCALVAGLAFLIWGGPSTPRLNAYTSAGGHDPLIRANAGGGIAWLSSEPEATQRSRAEGRPLVIDFWARWCKPCLQIKEKVFTHPAVVEEAKRFVALEIDCKDEPPDIQRLMKRYGVSGLPAVIFVDSQGRVRADLSVFELLPASEFLDRMRKVR